MQPAIAIHDLTKTYGDLTALDHLSLEVYPGEIVGFLGPNGAGKTTTIRLLLDLIRPTSGRSEILGHDCRKQSHLVRAVTGYLPGELHLYSGRTGWETVELVAGLRGKSLDRRYASHLAASLGFDLRQHAGTLSKGNRQKLGVLLAMFDRPEVYLLDEPTSGLDPLTQHTVWTLLRSEADRGATIFFSSHVMSEVERVCERVAILRTGTLVAVEPIAAMKERVLRRMEITFADAIPERALDGANVREVQRSGNTVTLEISGHLDELIKSVAHYPVVDLRTEQASLDEILLAFYTESRA